MPFPDLVPEFGEGYLSTYYRNVLGVPVRKRVIIASVFILTLLLIFVCALLLNKRVPEKTEKVEVTFAPYVPVSNSIDYSVDPCADFYNFTCGHWARNDLVVDFPFSGASSFTMVQDFVNKKKRSIFEHSHWSRNHPRVVNEAISFYQNCVAKMNLSSSNDLDNLIKYFQLVLGGWPALNKTHWVPSKFDWINASAAIYKTLNIGTIMDVYSIIDDKNSSRKMLYFKLPSFSEAQFTLEEYTGYCIMLIVTKAIKDEDFIADDFTENVNKINKVEQSWRQCFTHPISSTNRTRYTFRELEERIPSFDWLYYIQLLLNDTLQTHHDKITDDTELIIEDARFFESSFKCLQSKLFSSIEVANLFGWFIIQKIWFLIPGLLKDYTSINEYTEEEKVEIMENKCFDTVLDLYQCSIEYLYIKNSTHSRISDGEILVNHIKGAFRNLLSDSMWLDDQTKMSALSKLNKMKSFIGFPSYLSNIVEFDSLYEDFPHPLPSTFETYLAMKSSFASNVVNAITSRTNNSFYYLPRPITHVSAYYDLQRNIFTLPLSVYNPPFYYYKKPWHMNFGAIGAIIGHEIMHGFDRGGCQRDGDGTLKEWWTETTAETYNKYSFCYKDQYAQYENITQGEGLTLDEDIADNEGVHIAYLAYKKWVQENGVEKPIVSEFSPEQLFFLSFSAIWCSKEESIYNIRQHDVSHSLPRSRVNGVMSNSAYFSEAFNCPIGSPMNPKEKCTLW